MIADLSTVVIFGAPGTLVSSNTIIASDRQLLGVRPYLWESYIIE